MMEIDDLLGISTCDLTRVEGRGDRPPGGDLRASCKTPFRCGIGSAGRALAHQTGWHWREAQWHTHHPPRRGPASRPVAFPLGVGGGSPHSWGGRCAGAAPPAAAAASSPRERRQPGHLRLAQPVHHRPDLLQRRQRAGQRVEHHGVVDVLAVPGRRGGDGELRPWRVRARAGRRG